MSLFDFCRCKLIFAFSMQSGYGLQCRRCEHFFWQADVKFPAECRT